VRAAELLASADVVLHDDALAALAQRVARAEARLVSVRPGTPAAIEATAAAARGTMCVVRLLAGDVLSTGAGTHEAVALFALGLAPELVPGLPVEHAALNLTGVVVAGEGAGGEALLVRVEGEPGASGSPRLRTEAVDPAEAARRLAAAAEPGRATALVRGAGTPGQRVELAGAGEPVPAAPEPGATLVTASEEALRARLRWFEERPLFGRAVVVTRPRAQAADFGAWLESQGAEPVLFPAIRVVPPPDPAPLARAAAEAHEYDWVIFTSANGVERFWQALAEAGRDARALSRARVAAIGPATAQALAERGIRADVVPERYVAESVAAALEAGDDLAGKRILLPRAAGAREVLPERLAAAGALVTEIEAYRSVPDGGAAEELRLRLAARQIDVVAFTSSSTVQNFVQAVGTDLGGAVVACIGPITAESARQAGLIVSLVAGEHTLPGLQAALLDYFDNRAE
jgi:uroporphyrinogen III methyltransferase/synthase